MFTLEGVVWPRAQDLEIEQSLKDAYFQSNRVCCQSVSDRALSAWSVSTRATTVSDGLPAERAVPLSELGLLVMHCFCGGVTTSSHCSLSVRLTTLRPPGA